MATKKVGILVAVAGATIAMGGVYATSLTVTAQQASSGAGDVASCQVGALTFTGADPEYNAGTGKYRIASVTVSGITSPACDGNELYVTAVDGSDVALSTGTAVSIDASSEVFTFTTPVDVDSLNTYVAAITAPNA